MPISKNKKQKKKNKKKKKKILIITEDNLPELVHFDEKVPRVIRAYFILQSCTISYFSAVNIASDHGSGQPLAFSFMSANKISSANSKQGKTSISIRDSTNSRNQEPLKALKPFTTRS